MDGEGMPAVDKGEDKGDKEEQEAYTRSWCNVP